MGLLNLMTPFVPHRRLLYYGGYILMVLLVISCKSYQANILLTVDENQMEELSRVVVEVHENYVVSPNDHLQIEVYTNKGEQLIDPNNALNRQLPSEEEIRQQVYMVQPDGTADLPIIGQVRLGGMTLREVNNFLAREYQEYYKDPFVQTKYLNKRVVVLGADESRVIPLENDGMNLLEVLALAGGVSNDAKGHNIRLIRGPLDNPQVQVIDLSTIEGMTKANLEIQPNDIVYIEPVRRPFTESLRDIVPVLSIITSVLALVIAINN